MTRRFEIWTNDNNEKFFCYGDSEGDAARNKLKAEQPNARILHMYYAISHVDAMNYFQRYIGGEPYNSSNLDEYWLFK